MTNKLIVEFVNSPSLGDELTLTLSRLGVNTAYELQFTSDEDALEGQVFIGNNEEEAYSNLAIALVKQTNFQVTTSVQEVVSDPYPFIDKFDLIYGANYDDIKYIGSIKYNKLDKEVIFFQETIDGTPTPTNLWEPGNYFIIQPRDGSPNRIILLVTDYPTVQTGYLYTTSLAFNGGEMTLSKYDLNSNLIWSLSYSFFGGSLNSVSVDSDGNVYTGGDSGLLYKLDTDGNLIWTKNHGNVIYDIKTDSSYVYISGNRSNSDNMTTRKYDLSGNLIWSVDHGASITSIDVDSDGNVYTAGGRIDNITTRKYNSSGTLLWSVNHGDAVHSLSVDSDGNVYTVGDRTSNTNNLTTRKYDSSGNLLWSVDHGNTVRSVTVDSDGNVYTGGNRSSNLTTRKYDSSGNLLWSRDHGSTVYSVALDSDGNVYTSGSSVSNLTTRKYDSSGNLLWSFNGTPYSITDMSIYDPVGTYYKFPIEEIYSDFNLKDLDLYYVQYFTELTPITKSQLSVEPIGGVRIANISGSFDLIVIEEPIFFENQLESLLRSSQFMFNPSTSVANYVKVRFTIKMLQNPAIGHRVIFIGTVTQNGSTSFGVFGLDKTATTSTNNTNNFIRGSNLAASLQNLYNSIVLTYGSITSIQVTLNSAANEIYVDVTDAANLTTRTYGILVDYYNTNATFQNTVSTIPIGGFDTVKYGIKVWEGDRYDDEPTTNNYEKTKQKIVPSQIRTYIDFNQFCKDKMEFDVNSHIQITPQVSNIPNKVGRWVKVTAQNFNLGQPGEIISNTYYATDGWLKDGELHTIPNILTTNLNRVISRSTIERVYFKTQYLSSISYRINGGTAIPVMIGADIDKTNEYIKSMALPPIDPNTKTISMRFNYTYPDFGFNRISVDFTISDSCFYKPVDLIYKNKWGVLETLSFNKVSVRKLEREGSQYQRSIVDMNGSYDISRHTKKEYNVDGMESWTLNTNWVPQNLNSQFEDLMMSEEVYMRYVDEYTNSNFIKPVLVKTDSIDFKTKSVNKLINYTIEVELSHNKINNFL